MAIYSMVAYERVLYSIEWRRGGAVVVMIKCLAWDLSLCFTTDHNFGEFFPCVSKAQYD